MKASERADRLFHALADPTRRDIITRALHAELSVSTLSSYYPISFAAVQKHIAVLERAELVTKRHRGRERLVRSNITTIRDASRVFDQFEGLWRSRIDRFGEVLADDLKKGANR